MAKAPARDRHKGDKADQRIEWVVGTVAAVLTLGIIGFLAFEALSSQAGFPLLAVERTDIVRTPNYHLVQVMVVNRGHATAADVVVEGRLGAGEAAENATVTVDFVPPGPGVKAALVFETDPASAELVLSVKGYTRP